MKLNIIKPFIQKMLSAAWKMPAIFMQLQTVIRLSSHHKNEVSASSGRALLFWSFRIVRDINCLSQHIFINSRPFDDSVIP